MYCLDPYQLPSAPILVENMLHIKLSFVKGVGNSTTGIGGSTHEF